MCDGPKPRLRADRLLSWNQRCIFQKYSHRILDFYILRFPIPCMKVYTIGLFVSCTFLFFEKLKNILLLRKVIVQFSFFVLTLVLYTLGTQKSRSAKFAKSRFFRVSELFFFFLNLYISKLLNSIFTYHGYYFLINSSSIEEKLNNEIYPFLITITNMEFHRDPSVYFKDKKKYVT